MAIFNKSMRNGLRIITFYCKRALRMDAKGKHEEIQVFSSPKIRTKPFNCLDFSVIQKFIC